MEDCKELLSRASEIRSFYTVQGSYNRSGCWSQILIAKTCLVIFFTHKKTRFEPETYFNCLVVWLFLLLIFISHTQTVCNCVALCVSITFTSYPRSFLLFPITPPHNLKSDGFCAELHKSQENGTTAEREGKKEMISGSS